MVVAHQGGWDEVLFVALPILLGVWLLWLANRRAEARLAAEDREAGASPSHGEGGPAGPYPEDASP